MEFTTIIRLLLCTVAVLAADTTGRSNGHVELEQQASNGISAQGYLHAVSPNLDKKDKQAMAVAALQEEMKHTQEHLSQPIQNQFHANKINYFYPGAGAFAYAKFGENADIMPMLKDSQVFVEPKSGNSTHKNPRLMQVSQPVTLAKTTNLLPRDPIASATASNEVIGTADFGIGTCINCDVHYTVNLNDCQTCCQTCTSSLTASLPTSTASRPPFQNTTTPIAIHTPSIPKNANGTTLYKTRNITLACPTCPSGTTVKPYPTAGSVSSLITGTAPKPITVWTTKIVTQTLQCPTCPGKVSTVVKTTSSPCPILTSAAPPYQNTSISVLSISSTVLVVPSAETSIITPVVPGESQSQLTTIAPIPATLITTSESSPIPAIMSSVVASQAPPAESSLISTASPPSQPAPVTASQAPSAPGPVIVSPSVPVSVSQAASAPISSQLQSSQPPNSPATPVSPPAEASPPALSSAQSPPQASSSIPETSGAPISQLSDNQVVVPHTSANVAEPSGAEITSTAPGVSAAPSAPGAPGSTFIPANGAESSAHALPMRALISLLAIFVLLT